MPLNRRFLALISGLIGRRGHRPSPREQARQRLLDDFSGKRPPAEREPLRATPPPERAVPIPWYDRAIARLELDAAEERARENP